MAVRDELGHLLLAGPRLGVGQPGGDGGEVDHRS